MQIVLTHIGTPLPPYLESCIAQIRAYTNMDLYFVSDSNEPNFFSKYKSTWVPAHEFPKFSHVDTLLQYPNGDFWNATLKRLYYLDYFIRGFNLSNTIHFENDVLIYKNPIDLIPTLEKNYKNIAITRGTNLDCMTGFMYLNNNYSLTGFIQFMESSLKNPGFIQSQGYEMLHEMALLGSYLRLGNPDNIDVLPSLPFGPLSHNLEAFGGLFDPASWGQYALGTHSCPKPGWAENRHYIGREIIQKTVSFEWQRINNRMMPIVHDLVNDRSYPLFNLHVHSKNLEDGR